MTKTKTSKSTASKGNAGVNATAELTPEAWAQAAECLRVLAHPTRLRMVQMLLRGRFAVGEIAEECEIAPNLASEHLRLMQRVGFLTSEKEARSVYYIVIEPQLANILECVEKRFAN